MPVSVSVQRIDAAFSRTIAGTENDFDVVTVKSAGADVVLFVGAGRGGELAEAILMATGDYDCADCGCYTPEPAVTDPHLCAECDRARADDAAALREMADDDRAHAAADRRAGL